MKTTANAIDATNKTPARSRKPSAPVYFVDPDTGDVLEFCLNTATFTK